MDKKKTIFILFVVVMMLTSTNMAVNPSMATAYQTQTQPTRNLATPLLQTA